MTRLTMRPTNGVLFEKAFNLGLIEIPEAFLRYIDSITILIIPFRRNVVDLGEVVCQFVSGRGKERRGVCERAPVIRSSLPELPNRVHQFSSKSRHQRALMGCSRGEAVGLWVRYRNSTLAWW